MSEQLGQTFRFTCWLPDDWKWTNEPEHVQVAELARRLIAGPWKDHNLSDPPHWIAMPSGATYRIFDDGGFDRFGC